MDNYNQNVFKECIINHLIGMKYNLNQNDNNENTFSVCPFEDVSFVIVFEKDYLLIVNFISLQNTTRIDRLELTNRLNKHSLRLKFCIEDDILRMDLRLPIFSQFDYFQNVLEEISFDMNELLADNNLIDKVMQ